MKTLLSWLLLLSLVCIQVIVGQNFGLVFALPLSAILLVVFSVFLPFEQLLYMALLAGIFLDFASGQNFGLNMTFLLFIVVFCKLVMRLGQREQSIVVLVLISGLFILLYNFLQLIGIFSADHLSELPGFMSQLGLQLVYSAIWTLVLYYAVSWIVRTRFGANINTLKWLK